jgi:acetyl-CoA acetyltransferase
VQRPRPVIHEELLEFEDIYSTQRSWPLCIWRQSGSDAPHGEWSRTTSPARTKQALDPNGGAIALGHPLDASGARHMMTLSYFMRAEGIRFGIQTMSEAGGLANFTIFGLL